MTQDTLEKWKVVPVEPPVESTRMRRNRFADKFFVTPIRGGARWPCPRPPHCWLCEEFRHHEISKTAPYWGA